MTGNDPSSVSEAPNQKDPPHTEPYAKPQGEPIRRDSYTVLVIDDDVMFLRFMTSVLRKHGFNVLTASSGVKGLNMLTSGPSGIQVVLLDYTMPHLDGDETLQHMRKRWPSIRVVAVTVSDPNLLPASFRERVDSFIEKPVHAQELVDTIDSLAGSEPPATTSRQV